MLEHFNKTTAAMLVIAALTAAPVQAQKASAAGWHPDRPVTLVVPYGAGGGTDAAARAVARRLGEIWRQPVVIENIPGADGLIGTRKVIDARPDGYTLLMQVPSLTLIKYAPGLKGIDPVAQLEPITSVAQSPATLVVSSKVPAKSFSEFVQYCKTAAQPCSIATGENIARILARMLAAEGGVPNLIVVNYKGSGPMVADLISNNVNAAFTGIAAVLPHQKAGTLRVLSTQGQKRAPSLPDTPTTAEAGFPAYRAVSWFGMFAPKGTPPAITQGIAQAVREAVKDESVQKALSVGAAEPVGNTPAQFAAEVKEEGDRLGALVKRYPLE